MAQFLGDYVCDNGLSAIDTLADKIYICSALPTTYTGATSTVALGNNNFGSAGAAFGAPAAGSPDGRKVSSVAITAGSITATGTATHWAVVDSANSRLLAANVLASSQSVTSGNPFTLPSFDIRIPGS